MCPENLLHGELGFLPYFLWDERTVLAGGRFLSHPLGSQCSELAWLPPFSETKGQGLTWEGPELLRGPLASQHNASLRTRHSQLHKSVEMGLGE